MRYDSLNNKSNNNILKKIAFLIFIFCIIFCYLILFLLYGPINNFRDWLITTAMNTMNHQYLATIFYDSETIIDCLSRNSISKFSFATNTNEIEIIDYTKLNNINYKNEYEKQILEKSSKNNDYKIIKIDGEKYTGYLAVIYEPNRVKIATTKYLNEKGQYLTTISKENKALVAINAGGFRDSGNRWGGEPLGITIKNRKIICEDEYNQQGGIVGITDSHKLYLGDISSKQALAIGIRDSISFGPYLIVNGKSANVSGNGGQGLSPRTAIGQRKDGIILFLVLDGNRMLGQGASILDVLEIMERYEAYNATCLDGGTSTGMTVHGNFINKPTTRKGEEKSRPIPTAFILKEDDSDDGDCSAITNID